jgi:hypothetical protein
MNATPSVSGESVFPIQPSSTRAYAILFGLAVFVLLLAAFVAVLAVTLKLPALFIAAAICLVVMALAGYAARSSRRTQLEVSAAGLRVRGDLFGRSIAREDLLPAQAAIVNLDDAPELKPKWRLCGTAVPGYLAGWFKLCGGRKALVFVTDTRRVVCVPTRKGWSFLASVAEPERLLKSVQEIG